MAFAPMSTKTAVKGAQKTLLYAHHGYGKTTQAKYLQRYYGKGFVISGESGLLSLMDEDIDFLPFQSWADFKAICAAMQTAEFKDQGYTWIMVDSLTELSDRCFEAMEAAQANKPKQNGFELWGDYGSQMIGAMKYIRDLPYHVLVTALAKEDTDENGRTEHWPFMKGRGPAKQIPGMFDHVFGGVRATIGEGTASKVERYLITEEVRGWHGKSRDPRRRLLPVEKTGDVTQLFRRMDMDQGEHEKFLATIKAAAPVTTEKKD